MAADPKFRTLMARLQAGSEEAARELVETYGWHVIRAVRRRLNPVLRSKYDSTDFTQAVWASFFADPAAGPAFDSPGSLVTFLKRVAAHKLADAWRARGPGGPRDVGRERHFDSVPIDALHRAAAGDVTPGEAVIAGDEWERFLDGQPPRYREILILLRRGHTHAEIARCLGISAKTVQRLVRRVAPGYAS